MLVTEDLECGLNRFRAELTPSRSPERRSQQERLIFSLLVLKLWLRCRRSERRSESLSGSPLSAARGRRQERLR